MKIEHGTQNPAKTNGFANLNRHDGKAHGSAAASQHSARTHEGKSGCSHTDGHKSVRYDKPETGAKTCETSRHNYDNGKNLDTKNRHDSNRHDQWDGKHFAKDKNPLHYYDNRRNYDDQRSHDHRHSYNNQRNFDHQHVKKLVLHKSEHLHKVNIRHFDHHKNICFHPISSKIRINIKNLDQNKHLMRPLLSLRDLHHHRSSITIIKLNVYNVPNFKLGGINHNNQTASGIKVKNADIYGLNEKQMASVLRLLDITMKVKQECYGNKLNYAKEYEKALKSWVGHFGGTYVPRGDEKHGHGQGHCDVHKNGMGVGYVHGNVYSSARGYGKAQGHAGYYASKPDFAQFTNFKVGAQKYHGKYYIADHHFGRGNGGKNNFHKDFFNWRKS